MDGTENGKSTISKNKDIKNVFNAPIREFQFSLFKLWTRKRKEK